MIFRCTCSGPAALPFIGRQQSIECTSSLICFIVMCRRFVSLLHADSYFGTVFPWKSRRSNLSEAENAVVSRHIWTVVWAQGRNRALANAGHCIIQNVNALSLRVSPGPYRFVVRCWTSRNPGTCNRGSAVLCSEVACSPAKPARAHFAME